MVRIKVVGRRIDDSILGMLPSFEHNGCIFSANPDFKDYDWLVVYDEIYKTTKSISSEYVDLECPREHTILVTVEPPSIKVYPRSYTSQFEYVLTTHSPEQLPHPNHRYSEGGLWWCADYPLDEAFSMPEYEKTKCLSTVCSARQQTHTLHQTRYNLVKYISENVPELDWFGYGVIHLEKKYVALSPYRYHIAMENYIAPYHWTDKISDPLLGLCLTFYAGDPCLPEVFPADCYIPIPADNPEEACRIIKEAIANHEYEKRLPAIREARRLMIEKYNFYSRIAAVVHEAQAKEGDNPPAARPCRFKGRHLLRRNPINALAEVWETLKVKMALKRIRKQRGF